ncbi:sperm-associated antigen 4 protein-like [Gymnogyps californianus]|uniref:sperm-associated antigen 4 protein-like n=1 Tax=Gymnogyps californianus TaxID=33616 RepID=UPI0021CAD249|nr:sperm-associated antigen 4 protein-like [Gymnogyps californianus]
MTELATVSMSVWDTVVTRRAGLQCGNGRGLHPETPQPRPPHCVSTTRVQCGHGDKGCRWERDRHLEKDKALHNPLLDEPRCSWNSLTLLGKQSQEVQQLRDEVASLAAEIGTMKKEVQRMREAMSATTQMSDWALKSAGAAIDLQRSSSSSTWLYRVFWFMCAPPLLDTFVQPDTSPGYCWPFQGSQSEVLIRLPTQIRPTAITIQHASKIASPLGTVSSTPRDFTVSGLDEEGKDETLLGTFTYAMRKEPTQTFPLQNGIPRDFRVLKLVIRSNWGKPGYTCIYRVQVYGKTVGTNATGQTHVETFSE